MAGLAIDGLISNLNTTEIIDAILFQQRAPAIRLQNRRDATTGKLQAVQGLNASVLGVRVAAEGLSDLASFRGRTAESSNSAIATATATTASDPGTFTLSVQQLARAEQISSDPSNVFTDAETALGLEGTVRVNGTNVAIRSTDTLRDVASRLSNSRAGVSANVVEVQDGEFRLSIRSLQTGASGIQISNLGTTNVLEGLRLAQATDSIASPITDGAASNRFNVRVQPVAGLLGLTQNIPSGTVTIGNGSSSINVAIDLATQSLDDIAANINSAASGAGSSISATVAEVEQGVFQLQITSGDATTPTFTDSQNILETIGIVRANYTQVDQDGQDAEFRVNGIDVVRSTNNVSDVVSGVTFTLLSDETPTATTNISVLADSQAGIDAVQSFVNAFNATRAYISQFGSFNSETQQAGILLGDSSVFSVESSLGSLLSRSISTLPSQTLDSLNGGGGIPGGSIRITDKSGNVADIDLSQARTVQDVLTAINVNPEVEVEARINRSGTGLVLEDISGSAGTLRVEEINGGTTAAGLGILGSNSGQRLEGTSIATAEFLSLSQIGITANIDGTLSLDSTKLQQHLDTNPLGIQAFFTQPGGFGAQARNSIDALTDSTNGVLTGRATSLQENIESYNQSIDSITDRLELAEVRLRRQFSTLEQTLSQLQQQGDYVLNQLSQLNSSNQR